MPGSGQQEWIMTRIIIPFVLVVSIVILGVGVVIGRLIGH